MRYIIGFIVLPVFLLFSSSYASTDSKPPEVGIQEHLGASLPLSLEFVNSEGKKMKLGDYIKDKPVILNFVYYQCPGICSPLLTGLTNSLSKIALEPGKDFKVLSVSFNHREGTELAKKWKNRHIKNIKRDFPDDAWEFVTGDSVSIRKLTDAAGFYFKVDGEDFIHAGTLIAVTPTGKISRYLFGTSFLPFDLKMAMVEASEGKSSPTINKVLEYCFSYDPEGNKYVFNITKVVGTFIFLSIAVFFTVLVLKGRKKSKKGHDDVE